MIRSLLKILAVLGLSALISFGTVITRDGEQSSIAHTYKPDEPWDFNLVESTNDVGKHAHSPGIRTPVSCI